MTVWLLFAMFAGVVGGFSLYGLWDWWKPRRDLTRLFVERRRERCAANIIRSPTPVRGGGCGCREVTP